MLTMRTKILYSIKAEEELLKKMWFQEILKDGQGRTFYKVGWRGHSSCCAGENEIGWQEPSAFNPDIQECLSKENDIQMGSNQSVRQCVLAIPLGSISSMSLPPTSLYSHCELKLTSPLEWRTHPAHQLRFPLPLPAQCSHHSCRC